jgi:hypothetical protein
VMLHEANPDTPGAHVDVWTVAADGGHQIVTPDAPGLNNLFAVYSSGRAATVVIGQPPPQRLAVDLVTSLPRAPQVTDVDTWAFDGSSWTWLASLSMEDILPTALSYDPLHGRVVLSADRQLWALGDAAVEWTRLADTPSDGIFALAWEARIGRFMAIGPIAGSVSLLFELGEAAWSPIDVLPGIFNQPRATVSLVSDQRSGGVIGIEAGLGTVWERVGGDWRRLPDLPDKKAEQAWMAYNPVDGSVLYVGRSPQRKFAAIMTRTSATPLESCNPGEDLDGDGLVGCDDPDCYWACSRCVPHTTCP